MSTTANQPTNPIITPSELLSAPMEPCHKDLVLRHYYRLCKTLYQPDQTPLANYTNKQAAREQRARMTLLIRDYIRLPKCSDNEIIESMVADVVDASLSISGPEHRYSQSIFINSQVWGREQEIASILQELDAEGADDVVELWNVVAKKTNKVVPDAGSDCREDLPRDVNWNDVLFRSRSESNLLWRKGVWEVEDPDKWTEELHSRKLEELDLLWPPNLVDPQPTSVTEQRRRTNTISMGT